MKGKLQIAVLFGGCSPEYEVSLQSASTVIQHMDRKKFVPVPIGITRQGDWYHFNGDTEEIARDTWHTAGNCTPFSLPLGRTSPLPFDAAFPVLHGQNGEDGTVQGLFKLMGIQNMTLKYSALDPIFGQEQYTQIPMAVLGIVMKFSRLSSPSPWVWRRGASRWLATTSVREERTEPKPCLPAYW